MAGSIWSSIDPTVTSGTQLATLLNSLKDAYTTNVKGTSRPANLAPGGCWLDSTSEAAPDYLWTLKMYDGTDDIALMTINISTNSVYVAGSTDTFTITHTSADAVGPNLVLRKKRIATNGKVLSGDVVGLLEMRSTDQVGTEVTLAGSIEAVATEDHTSTAHGTKLDFYIKKIGTTTRSLIASAGDLGLSAFQFVSGYTTTATAAGTTNLTAASNYKQYFTGVTTQTVVLPVCTTLGLNTSYKIVNSSTGNLTVNSSGGNLVQTLLPNTTARITCILASGTTAASWQVEYISNAAAATATALTAMLRDSNANALINNLLNGYTTTATAAGTTTLVVGSTNTQIFTGVTTQTVVLPVVSTLALNHPYYIVNNSTGIVTVNSSGSNLIKAIPAGGTALFFCILTTGTTAASWFCDYGIGAATADILTLKDYDGGTATNTSRFTLGKAATSTLTALTRKQGTLHFDTTRNKPVYDDGTNLKVVGSGSGGTKNYIDGGDAESGTTGFATYALTESVTFTDAGDTVTLSSHGLRTGDLLSFSVITSTTGISINTAYYAIVSSSSVFQVASSLANAQAGTALALTTNGTGTMLKSFPKTGTGGSPSSTFTTSSSAPLADANSFLWTKSANNRMGEGWSYDFTIDSQDKAKVLQIGVKYLVSSGTFVAQSGSIPSDMVFWIFDVTNAVWIQPSSISLLSNSTTIVDGFSATFQSSSNSTSYRLCCHTYSVSASAYTLQFDSITVSPSTYVFGTPITDWQSYTPTFTGVGTAASVDVRWRRVGDSLQVSGIFTTGTCTGSSATFTLPSGLTIDTTKTNATAKTYGQWTRQMATATTRKRGVLIATNATGNLIYFGSDDYTTAANPNSGLAGSTAFANAESETIELVNLPILGWSSSVQMSDQADTRVVACRVGGASTNVNSDIIFPTVALDTHGGYNASTGVYTIKVPGKYSIYAQFSAAGAAGSYGVCWIKQNGTVRGTGTDPRDTARTAYEPKATALIDCLTGDTITVSTSQQTVGGSPAVSNVVDTTFLQIERVSGPSAIAATETLSACAHPSANTSVTGGNPIIYNTVDWDSHGVINTTTGRLTAPISGTYRVSGLFLTTAAVASWVILYKNGSTYKYMAYSADWSNTGGSFNATVKLLAGDYITIVPSATLTPSGSPSGTPVRVEFDRTGNY